MPERRGETIPLGYALDAQGRPTTDPKAALAGGVVLPIGEHKGSGISMFMDIFARDLGANFGGEVGDQYKTFDRAQDVGHFFLAMKAQSVRHRGRLSFAYRHADRPHEVRAARRRNSEVLVPGEPEDRYEEQRRRSGIPTRRARSRRCRNEAKRAGIQPLVISDKPIVPDHRSGKPRLRCGNLVAVAKPSGQYRDPGT